MWCGNVLQGEGGMDSKRICVKCFLQWIKNVSVPTRGCMRLLIYLF